ncbi:MAG: serine/threonine protein kinase, partial [Myxococcales bacterium]|nr:serine/threonine protein kinase [Myxococcales bacterium]
MDMTVDGGTAGSSGPPGGPPRLAAGTRLGGRFTIEEFLGQSPFAEIFRASDASDGKKVVIKWLHRELLHDAHARARLEQELAIAAQLEHKNISQTYGFWFEGEQPYLAVEDLEGTTLREMLEKKRASGRAFSLKGAYNVIAHVCNALAYAHGALVHGALTTGSVVVNAAGRVKLTDFGIGRALPSLDGHPYAAHLLASMAPEMMGSPDQIDRRADIYSVGAILFELLTGNEVPEHFVAPSSLVPGLPPALDPVIERCLRPTPTERFGDAQELKHALHAAVEGMVTNTPSAVAALPKALALPPPMPPGRPPPSPARPSPPPTTAKGPPAPAAAAPRPSRPVPVARAPIAPSFNVASALSAVDESQERWLIQKDKLDFGPFRLADVKHQIEKGQIKGDHTIVDMENGERRRVKEHPMLRDFILGIEGKNEDQRRIDADAAEARRHKRNLVTLLSVIVGVLILGGGAAGYYFGVYLPAHPNEKTKIVYKDRDAEDLLKGIEITMKVDPPVPKV